MKTQRKIIISLLLGLFILFNSNLKADAATGIMQTAQTENSITITFDSTKYVTGKNVFTGWSATLQKYVDGNKVDVQPAVPVAANVNTYTFSNLEPGTRYYAKVDYTYNDYKGVPKNSSYSLNAEIFTAPGKVTGANQIKWWYFLESVKFGWDKQETCKYEWKAYKGEKEIAGEASTYSNEASFKVKNGKLYKVKVRAFNTINGQTIYGEWSDLAYLFTQPMITEKKGSIYIDRSGKMHIKWEKITEVDGYEVFVSTKEKSGYKRVAKVKGKKNSVTVKKFKKKKFNKNKTYYVYVVAKKKINGAFSTSGRLYSTRYKKGSNKLMWSFSTR